MKTPEQLQLNFSANEDTPPLESSKGAVVYQFDRVRDGSSAARVSLAAVYEAIHETVKHISVRRRLRPSDFVESSFS